jgi:hypothetical protein
MLLNARSCQGALASVTGPTDLVSDYTPMFAILAARRIASHDGAGWLGKSAKAPC